MTLLFLVEVVRVLVDCSNVELRDEIINEAIRLDLIIFEEVVSSVHEARLSHLKVNGRSLFVNN